MTGPDPAVAAVRVAVRSDLPELVGMLAATLGHGHRVFGPAVRKELGQVRQTDVGQRHDDPALAGREGRVPGGLARTQDDARALREAISTNDLPGLMAVADRLCPPTARPKGKDPN